MVPRAKGQVRGVERAAQLGESACMGRAGGTRAVPRTTSTKSTKKLKRRRRRTQDLKPDFFTGAALPRGEERVAPTGESAGLLLFLVRADGEGFAGLGDAENGENVSKTLDTERMPPGVRGGGEGGEYDGAAALTGTRLARV